MNSRGSASSCCQSITERTHSSHSGSGPLSLPFLGAPGLYEYQCAAMPSSAVSCISRVRTWISSGRPCGPITVVCSAR